MIHKIFKTLLFSLMILSYADLIMSCAQVKKDMVSTNTANTDLITRLENDEKKVKKAYEDQWDVLAYNDIKKSSIHVENARTFLTRGAMQEKITEELRESELSGIISRQKT